MKSKETSNPQDSQQLASEGASFLTPPAFSLTASAASAGDGSSVQQHMQAATGVGGGHQLPTDPKVNVTLQESFGGSTTVEGMNKIGVQLYDRAGLGSQVRRYVLTGTKEQWATILKYTDDDDIFTAFVSGFLMACTDPSALESSGGYTQKENSSKVLLRIPTEEEKLEFLKALYGVEIDNGDLDLVNLMVEDGLAGAGIDVSSGPLAAFIQQNQHLLIQYVSESKDSLMMNRSSVGTLADQGTRDSYKPVVMQAMVQNAFATAVATAKLVAASSVKSSPQMTGMEGIDASDVIMNAALIIKGALDAYGDRVSGIADGAGEVFDEVWGMLPVPRGTGIDMVVGYAKGQVKHSFVKAAVGLASAEGMRAALIEAYHKIIKDSFREIINRYPDQLDRDEVVLQYNQLIDKFTNNLQ